VTESDYLNDETSGLRVRFSVSDNGIPLVGIRDDESSEVFLNMDEAKRVYESLQSVIREHYGK
jgi:hypothetical protein